MITLHKLRIFLTVYERGSFNRAANALLLAQSVVSEHIHSLETAFGAPLFLRSTRGVQPTEAGEIVHRYALQMLALLADAEHAVIQANVATAGQLTVGATPGVSVYLLPAWLQRFQLARTTITVSLQTALTSEITRDVLNGTYQLGFLEGALDELDDDHLGRALLDDIIYFVVVSAGHPWSRLDSGVLDTHALAAQPFINRQPTSRTRRWLDRLLTEHNVTLRNVAELDSPGAIKYALLNNMGVTILPGYAVEREAERGDLHLLHIAGLDMVRPLLMVWDRRRPFNPVQRAFINLLAEKSPALQLLL